MHSFFQKTFLTLTSLISCTLCFASIGIGYSAPIQDDYTIWQAFIAAIAGAVLTSSSLIFFIRRIIGQYDSKHKQHDADIVSLQKTIHSVEDNFKTNLAESTNLIMDTLNGLKDDLHEIITDVAILKEDRRRCFTINDRIDNNTAGLKILETQLDSWINAINRLEKQFDKQILAKK